MCVFVGEGGVCGWNSHENTATIGLQFVSGGTNYSECMLVAPPPAVHHLRWCTT